MVGDPQRVFLPGVSGRCHRVDWCVRYSHVTGEGHRSCKATSIVTTSTGVYSMRMSRVNITVPDDVAANARAAGLNVSRVATAALVEELDRRARTDALDLYLSQLDDELGPVSANEQAEAAAWADRVLAPASRRPSAKRRRSA